MFFLSLNRVLYITIVKANKIDICCTLKFKITYLGWVQDSSLAKPLYLHKQEW